ncbi:MAG: S-methyl-5-thioribose-1-phosphate isomerase [Gammaproteobacteria bacterium]|nr:S-methyl-5-thioribose-1-phosphate isomerase [Gammaproteobacteria bacterium]
MGTEVEAVQWLNGALTLLDQRCLPQQEVYLTCTDVAAVATAIQKMVVRGAPAIGIAAAYGVVLAAKQRYWQAAEEWQYHIDQDLTLLAQSRPTAVNLFWAIARMRERIKHIGGDDPVHRLLHEAESIHHEDNQANRCMGELGARLITASCNVLTHCNAGALATGGYGTALGVIRCAFRLKKIHQVYADETRPWLQGSRLTAWELLRDNIPVTLLADGAASYLMKQGNIGWVIVGADRIAANGDVANKIGTLGLAVNARYHGVKFMVVAPTSTVDLSLSHGDAIPIEHRPAAEVLTLGGESVAATGAQAWNPAFDITPAALIDAIVTEKGVIESPDQNKTMALMQNEVYLPQN